jgi:hypothetical protein
MKYYSNWQTALIDYIMRYGHEYNEVHNLIEEFNHKLRINKVGTYFIYYKDTK